jgi:hypothetical protein
LKAFAAEHGVGQHHHRFMTRPITDVTTVKPRVLLWGGHLGVWTLAAFAARLSRVGSQIEVHIAGLNGAELAPDHLRHILTAPTTEFKTLSFTGVIPALVLAIALRAQSPRVLRWITLTIAIVCFAVVALGYGH